MDWKNHIDTNPNVLLGKPVIKDTRISVELLLDVLAQGWSMEDILSSYPHLTREDVLAAIGVASEVFKKATAVHQ